MIGNPKHIIILGCAILLTSCTSNTILEAPKDLIPKDTMVLLLSDMCLANAAKHQKNILFQKRINYFQLVYDTYGIDSVRFQKSNLYYTSNIEEYEVLFVTVKNRLTALQTTYTKAVHLEDSIAKTNMKDNLIMGDTKLLKKKSPKSMLQELPKEHQLKGQKNTPKK